MLRYEAPGSRRAAPLSRSRARWRPSSRARSTRAARIAPCAPRPRYAGSVAATPSHPASPLSNSAPPATGCVPVVGDEAVPVGPADDAGREASRAPAAGRSPARRHVAKSAGDSASTTSRSVCARRTGSSAAFELLPCAVGDVPARLQLVVQTRLRIERDPVRPLLEDVFELLAASSRSYSPDDSVQLLDRRAPSTADRDGAAALAQTRSGRRVRPRPVAHRFEFRSLARPHPWDARLPSVGRRASRDSGLSIKEAE